MLSLEEILSLDYRCATDEAIRLVRLVEAKVQEKQAKLIEELSAALAAKDEVLEHIASGELGINFCVKLAKQALVLQPHASILNQIRADAITNHMQNSKPVAWVPCGDIEFCPEDYPPNWSRIETNQAQVQYLVNECKIRMRPLIFADRIEKGEA